MDNLRNQNEYRQIRTSSSQININTKYQCEDLVFLINNLNSDIKNFYTSIKQCLKDRKQNFNNKISSQQTFDLIEKYLNDFIDKAKATFKKMKYCQKINMIQQEINNYQMNNSKMKLNSENIYLNNNCNNNMKDKSYMNHKKILFDEDEYISSLCNNTNTSIKINNYFDSNNINTLNNINEYNNKYFPTKIKKIKNNSSNKLPIKNCIYNANTNYIFYKNKKHSSNPNNFSDPKIICHQYNGMKKNKNAKSMNDLGKVILVNKNSSSNNSLGKNNYYNSVHTHNSNNYYSSKKEILDNLNIIINSLKELRLINENIFNKSYEAEEHRKLLNKIFTEMNKLIKNIFNEQNFLNKSSYINSIFSDNDEYFMSENISHRSLSKNKKKENHQNNNYLTNNNNEYNLTYNYKTCNNNNEDDKIKDLNNNKYDMEIRARDLIIKKLKEELNLKNKEFQNKNIRYSQIKTKLTKNNINKFSSVSNSIEKDKNIILNEDSLNNNKISKKNIQELMESRKLILELQEKIKIYEKILRNKNFDIKKNNLEKQYELINQKYNELKKTNEVITLNNKKLKDHINSIYNKSDINIKQKNSYQKLYILKIGSFSIISNKDKNNINEEVQKIIDDLKNELQIKNENNDKLNKEINIYINGENKNKEEIKKLIIEISNYKNEEIKLKDDISNLNEEISKYKENISKIQKDNEMLNKKYQDNLIEYKSFQESIDKQNQSIEKYKKLIIYQEEEIKSLKNNTNNNFIKKDINNEIDNIVNDKNNNLKQMDKLQIEQDKLVLKYELLKNDYDKLNSTLQQKQKMLDNFSNLSNESSAKTNIDEQILKLVSEHKKEIEDLTKKYNQNIINLKMNLPIGYSPSTHCILVDKKFTRYNLRWFLLTIITAQEKDYENTFWVSEEEIKPMLDQFNTFRTEKEIEEEQYQSIYITQQKFINQIMENEKIISNLKAQLQKYENTNE